MTFRSSKDFSHIVSFELCARPYQWVEFKNVALWPKHPTPPATLIGVNNDKPTDSPVIDSYSSNESSYATAFRDHMKPWRMMHQTELKDMLTGKITKVENLGKIYTSIQALPIGSWAASTPNANPPDNVGLEIKDSSFQHLMRDAPSHQALQEDFSQYHDIRVATTMSSTDIYTVWASWAITKTSYKLISQGHHKEEKLIRTETPYLLSDI